MFLLDKQIEISENKTEKGLVFWGKWIIRMT